MSQKEFAARIGLSQKHVTQLLKGDVSLTPETASRLEMVLGVPALFWINLENIYQDILRRAREENQMDGEIAIARKFPYAKMAKMGWVATTKAWNERVVQLRQFFEMTDLSYLQKEELLPCISRVTITESRLISEGNPPRLQVVERLPSIALCPHLDDQAHNGLHIA